jgi:hypothetical protein
VTDDTQSNGDGGWASTREEWAKLSLHRVTFPSGFRALMRFVDLEALIHADAVPDRLLQIALQEVLGSGEQAREQARKLDEAIQAGELAEPRKLVGEIVDLQRWLTLESIIDPKLTLQDLESGRFDARDFEMARQIAMRERNTDAKGVFLGVAPLDLFTTFRELHDAIGGDGWANGHPAGVMEGCPACQTVADAFSSARQVRM